MNYNMHKTICLWTMGFALAVPAARAHGQNPAPVPPSMKSPIQELVRRGVALAPSNFYSIRGAQEDGAPDYYHCSPDFITATGAGNFSSLNIVHLKIDDPGYEVEKWMLEFEIEVPWTRDQISSQVQGILGPVIPPGFVYQGITPNDKYDKPDMLKFSWKGSDGVSIEIESGYMIGRYINFEVVHQLPR